MCDYPVMCEVGEGTHTFPHPIPGAQWTLTLHVELKVHLDPDSCRSEPCRNENWAWHWTLNPNAPSATVPDLFQVSVGRHPDDVCGTEPAERPVVLPFYLDADGFGTPMYQHEWYPDSHECSSHNEMGRLMMMIERRTRCSVLWTETLPRCTHCFSRTHRTKRSKACPYHSGSE